MFECFAPVGIEVEKTPISLSIEEYEAIRWIDLEGTSREECAAYMDILSSDMDLTLIVQVLLFSYYLSS